MMFLSMSYCLSWGTLLSSSTPCPPTNAYELCRKQSKVTFSGKFSLPTNHYSPSLYIIVWRKDRLPTPVFLGFPHGSDGKESACNAGDLGLIPGGEGPLEEAMATHSSIFAWRIPGTEEPGRLQSMGLQRVRQD